MFVGFKPMVSLQFFWDATHPSITHIETRAQELLHSDIWQGGPRWQGGQDGRRPSIFGTSCDLVLTFLTCSVDIRSSQCDPWGNARTHRYTQRNFICGNILLTTYIEHWDVPKAPYLIELPECTETSSTHLSAAAVDKCLNRKHVPINPHAQRLFTAEARAAAKLPKAKAKAKAKNEKAGSETKKTAKKSKTDKELQEESTVPRTEYSAKKDKFMEQEWLLDWIFLILGYIHWTMSTGLDTI